MTTLRFGNLRILRKLVICFAVIIAVALTSSAWIHQQRDTLTEADHWTDHTYQVIDQVNGALEGVLNQLEIRRRHAHAHRRHHAAARGPGGERVGRSLVQRAIGRHRRRGNDHCGE